MGKTTDDLLRLADDVSSVQPPRELDMLLTSGERISMALLCMALAELGVDAVSFTGSQAGIITDTTTPEGQDRRGQGRPAAGRAGRGPGPGGGRLPGGVARPRRDHARAGAAPTPPPWRWPPRSAPRPVRSTPTCPGCSAPTPASSPRPAGWPGSASRRCSRSPPAVGRVLALRSVEFARNHDVPLHVRSSFTWEPGTWVVEEDASMEQAVVTAVTHDTSEAKVTVTGVPDRPGIAARLFRALADRARQRGHDRAEHVAARDDRHLLHRARRPTSPSASRWPEPWPPRSARARSPPTTPSPRCRSWARG